MVKNNTKVTAKKNTTKKKFNPVYVVDITSTDTANGLLFEFAEAKFDKELPLNIYEINAIISLTKETTINKLIEDVNLLVYSQLQELHNQIAEKKLDVALINTLEKANNKEEENKLKKFGKNSLNAIVNIFKKTFKKK